MKNFIICLLCSVLLLFSFTAYTEETEEPEQEPVINLLEFSEDLEVLAQLHGQKLTVSISDLHNDSETEKINWE